MLRGVTMTKNSKALIGAIKAGQSWLKWDDEIYRATLMRITGRTSSTQCTLQELETMREYMHQQGYPRTKAHRHGRKPSVRKSRESVLSKIEALLADSGRKWDYAAAISLRMFNQQNLEWLTSEQLVKLMQALIMDARRKK